MRPDCYSIRKVTATAKTFLKKESIHMLAYHHQAKDHHLKTGNMFLHYTLVRQHLHPNPINWQQLHTMPKAGALQHMR